MVETPDKTPVSVVYKLIEDSSRKTVKSDFYVETETDDEPTYVHRIKLDSLLPNTSPPSQSIAPCIA